jgi:predicted TIM-barrel fold metal-dependent hydrolase
VPGARLHRADRVPERQDRKLHFSDDGAPGDYWVYDGKTLPMKRINASAGMHFMVEEWCGQSGGRLIPLCLVPLWDVELAADEVRRNADRGVRAVAFSEIPYHLGLPSIHSGYWDPFRRACAETRTSVNMHIGSWSNMPTSSRDAPNGVGVVLTFANSATSLVDFLFSGVLVRFPALKLAYSEGQIGWLPYVIEPIDDVWEQHRAWAGLPAYRLHLARHEKDRRTGLRRTAA